MTPEALTEKQARSQVRSVDAVESSASADISSTPSDDETRSRLEFELAIVLARQPKHRGLADRDDSSGDDPLKEQEAARNADDDLTGTLDTDFGGESMAADADDRAGSPSQSVETHRRGWLKSARRTTRSKLVGTVASFAITLLVTAFILSLVAMFLFGLPTNLIRGDDASSDTSIKQVGQPAKRTAPKPGAARSSWIFQGR